VETKQIRIPATLDLVEHARLGLNGLLGTLDPKALYEPYFLTFFAARPAYMHHWSSIYSGVFPKYFEALALLRHMASIQEPFDKEKSAIAAILDNISYDGLIYDRDVAERPWNCGYGYGIRGWKGDFATITGTGRLICGMYYRWQQTGDNKWLDLMQRSANAIMNITIEKDNYAYYPNPPHGVDFSYPKHLGWTNTNEPSSAQEGGEGSAHFYQSVPLRGLIKWYKLSGDKRALDISAKLARFVLKDFFWGDTVEIEPKIGASKAHFWGHYHGTLQTLRSLFEYAEAAEDDRVLEFVRNGFEWVRHNLCVPLSLDSMFEGCSTGDMMALSIQLSDTGAGDFWDNVEYTLRNSLVEAHIQNEAQLRKISDYGPERPNGAPYGAPFDFRYDMGMITDVPKGMEDTENVIEKTLGCICGWLMDGQYQMPMIASCCTGNGNLGYYFGWEAILRNTGSMTTINMFINRFSPWADVISWIPFEGRVLVNNKTSRSLRIRIPSYIKKSELRIQVNDNYVQPAWSGRYIVLTNLDGKEKIELTFPLEKVRRELYIPSLNMRHEGETPKVTTFFKGATCIGIERAPLKAGEVEAPWVKMFDRPEYNNTNTTPMRNIDYLPVSPIRWY
jgi:hypothetical protein